MSEKKDKKGKGKGKKKVKKEKKDGLSNHEREVLLQTISDLEHKIEWRNHMRDIIRADLRIYEEQLSLQKADKTEAVELLEKANEEEKKLCEKIKDAIPEAEEAKAQGIEERATELATKLLQMKNEKRSYDEQLESLRRKLGVLENHHPEEVKEKIEAVKRQQQEQKDSEKALQERLCQLDKRREEVFRKDMEDILAKEVASFQAEIAGRSNKKFQRITEETRWWAHEVSSLQMEKDRLELANRAIQSNLQESQNKLLRGKEASLQARQELREIEAITRNLERLDKELERENSQNAEYQNQISALDGLSNNLKAELEARKEELVASFYQAAENEKEIEMLEDKLFREEEFNCKLTEYFEKAKTLIGEEAMISLMVTHDEERQGKNTFKELRCLFERATKDIYNREHQTMI